MTLLLTKSQVRLKNGAQYFGIQVDDLAGVKGGCRMTVWRFRRRVVARFNSPTRKEIGLSHRKAAIGLTDYVLRPVKCN